MDDLTQLWPRVLAAIIIGILSGVAGFISRYWIESLLRGKGSDYLSQIKGSWQGTFKQRKGVVKEENITLSLNTKFNVIFGELKYGQRILKCIGYFDKDRYLSLRYRNKADSKLQHGIIILKLNGENDKLSGDFVGVGPVSEKIVRGEIEVSKNA